MHVFRAERASRAASTAQGLPLPSPSSEIAAPPLRTQASTSLVWNFQSLPTLWAGMERSAIQV